MSSSAPPPAGEEGPTVQQQDSAPDHLDISTSMTSISDDLVYQRDVAMGLAKKLAQDLDAKRSLLTGRLDNAQRLCAEAEVRLSKANREYQSKHLTLRKRMLKIVATLALSSLLGWLVCAFITQKFPLGAVLIFPMSLVVAVHMFGKLEGEDGLLELARS